MKYTTGSLSFEDGEFCIDVNGTKVYATVGGEDCRELAWALRSFEWREYDKENKEKRND